MRMLLAAALAVSLSPAVPPALALAAPQVSALGTPAPDAAATPSDQVRIAMRQEVLAPGGRLAEHRQEGERYLYVVTGQLKVSNLVTGEEQVVDAGSMAAETPGDWHVAEALGSEPVTLYVIDRGPADGAAAVSTIGGGN